MDNENFTVLTRAVSRRKAHDWVLVLAAMKIPYQIERVQSQSIILVPESMKDLALEQLRLFENENPRFFSLSLGKLSDINPYLFAIAPLLLAGFQILQFYTAYDVSWLDAGKGSADLILKGQWWRAVTALTLHADGGHLLSNLFMGSLLALTLCLETGIGLGWFLILVSGIAGNYLNIFAYQTSHNFIGFSTAVFGAIGATVGIHTLRKSPHKWRQFIIPFGVGLAMLSFLGTAPGTDVWAHLFGFASGLVIGLILSIPLLRFGKPGRAFQWVFGGIGVLVMVVSWACALAVR